MSSRLFDLAGYIRRSEYPSDGAVVERMATNDDGTITIIYDDNTFLTVKKVRS